MSTKVTLLVSTCDTYEDAWEPFFILLKKNWPDCPYPIVMLSEEKGYNGNVLDVRNVLCGVKPNGGRFTWSEMLLYALKNIESEYILFFLEDFFLMGMVDQELFQTAVTTMDEHKEIGVIQFTPHKEQEAFDKLKTYATCFSYIKKTCIYRINAQIAIWRKDFLVSLLDKREDAWQFEIYATKRAFWRKELVFGQTKAKPRCFKYEYSINAGYGLTHRKWLPKTVELFKENGIVCNFDNYGFFQKASLRNKRTFAQKMLMLFYEPKTFFKYLLNKINGFKPILIIKFYLSCIAILFRRLDNTI